MQEAWLCVILQVGACIVGTDNIILGIGYNGFPRGCPDGKLPWAKLSREGSTLDTKYPYVVHAEANCILNAKGSPTLANAVRPSSSSHDQWIKGESRRSEDLWMLCLFPEFNTLNRDWCKVHFGGHSLYIVARAKDRAEKRSLDGSQRDFHHNRPSVEMLAEVWYIGFSPGAMHHTQNSDHCNTAEEDYEALNCLLQAIYVTMFPCNECAKLIIQAGITTVVFFEVCYFDLCCPRPSQLATLSVKRI